MNLRAKHLAVILLLTVVFAVDDVVIYLILKDAFNWQTHPVLLAVGGIVVAVLNILGAVVARRSMVRKPTTGSQGMIGKTGVVFRISNGAIKIQVSGEIWQAESDEKLRVGDQVVVEGIEGLRLKVKKLRA